MWGGEGLVEEGFCFYSPSLVFSLIDNASTSTLTHHHQSWLIPNQMAGLLSRSPVSPLTGICSPGTSGHLLPGPFIAGDATRDSTWYLLHAKQRLYVACVNICISLY